MIPNISKTTSRQSFAYFRKFELLTADKGLYFDRLQSHLNSLSSWNEIRKFLAAFIDSGNPSLMEVLCNLLAQCENHLIVLESERILSGRTSSRNDQIISQSESSEYCCKVLLCGNGVPIALYCKPDVTVRQFKHDFLKQFLNMEDSFESLILKNAVGEYMFESLLLELYISESSIIHLH